MTLKLKGRERTGVPKAGPKKARAKRESDEELLRKAVEENTRAPKGARGGKPRSYKYKQGAKATPRPEVKLADPRELRSVRPPSALDLFTRGLSAEEKEEIGAEMLFQASCPHSDWQLTMYSNSVSEGMSPKFYHCPSCQATIRWWGGIGSTKQGEWQTYRIPGISPEDWGALYTRDKSLWRYIIAEAYAELQEECQ